MINLLLRNVFVHLCLMMAFMQAEELYWQGNKNNDWNNPSNWSTGQIPTNQDDVIIDGEQDLVLSSNVELSSLKIESSYSGTFNCGTYTIKINKGAFDAKYGGLDANQATLEFTGSEDQNFIFAYRENYGTIFNNKSSGALKFRSWAGLAVDTLKAAPGTLTELSRVGSITLNRYDIKGTASNRATLKSGADGERCIIFLKKGQNHVLSYVNLRDLWSLNGKGMLSDAHDHCIDGGNNRGFSFDHPVAYYTGLGEDENFSNPLNWGHGQVPSENHLLYLSKFMTNKDLVLDQDVKVAGLDTKRWRYAGRIRFGTHSMTVSGDFTPSTLMDTDEGTLILDGNQDQRVELVIPLELNRLEIKGEHRLIEFYQDIEVNKLDIQTGDIRFAAESTVAVNDAMIIGETNPVNLRPGNDLSGTMNTPWNFVVHNSATVSNARVRGSNADGGLTVAATQTEDQGLNANWTFDGALPFGSDSVIEFPETSAVSPAFVEGDYYFNATSIVAEAHGGSVNGQSLSDSGFFLNLPLDPAGEETAVSVTFNNEELTKKEGDITWTATTLNAGGSMTIRKGDSLLFTYNDGVSANFRIDIDADGVYGDTVTAGSLLPTQFNEAGVIEVSVQADPNGSLDQNGEIIFEEVAIYTVTVVDVDLRAPIAVEVGFERGKNIVIEPASEISNISFESSDEEVVEIRLHEERADGVRLSLTGMKRGFSSVIARLPNGQIISALELDEFVLSFSALEAGLLVDAETREAQVIMRMTPRIENIDFEYSMYGSYNTFFNGDSEYFENSSRFEIELNDNNEEVGVIKYSLFIAEGSPHMCHGIDVFQAGDPLEEINTRSLNVEYCEVSAPTSYICIGESETFYVTVTDSGEQDTSLVPEDLDIYVENINNGNKLGSVKCSPSTTNQESITVNTAGYSEGDDLHLDLIVKHGEDVIYQQEKVHIVFLSIVKNESVCIGEEAHLEIAKNGYNTGQVEWTIEQGDGELRNSQSDAAQYESDVWETAVFKVTWDGHGEFNCETHVELKVFDLYQLSAKDVLSTEEIPGVTETIYVIKGEEVEFEAGYNPAGTLGDERTKWYLDGEDTGATGDEYTKTFNSVPESGSHIVRAECGDGKVAIKVIVVSVEITCVVPEYYADSDSWLPFKFKVKGLSSDQKVEVITGKVEFLLDGNQEGIYDFMSTGGGKAKALHPDNGTAQEYITIIDPRIFDEVDTESLSSIDIKESAKLKIKEFKYKIVDGNGDEMGPFDSENSDSFKFADYTHEIIEGGVIENWRYDKVDTFQFKMDSRATNQFVEIKGTDGNYTTESRHNPTIQGFRLHRAKVTRNNDTYKQEAKLNDIDTWFSPSNGNGDFVLEAHSLDEQKGIYFFGYRNAVDTSPFGAIPVVGQATQSTANMGLFEGATYTAKVKQDETFVTETAGFKIGLKAISLVLPQAKELGFTKEEIKSAQKVIGYLVDFLKTVITPNNKQMTEVVLDFVKSPVIDNDDPQSDRPRAFNAEIQVRLFTTVGGSDSKIDEPLNLSWDKDVNLNQRYVMMISSSAVVRGASYDQKLFAGSPHYWPLEPHDTESEAEIEINLGNGEFNLVWEDINDSRIACE